MSPRILFRNKLVELVKELADFDDSNVSLYKLDRVDKTPHAAIYLGRMNSELETMGGDCNGYERDITVYIDFYSDHGTDADAQTDAWLVELEQLIYRAEKNDDLPGDMEDAQLRFAEFRPTSGGKEKRGDLVTAWVANFSETLTV